MAEKLIIIGAGGHGKVIADIAKLNGYKEIYFLDDDINKQFNGKYKVVGTLNDIGKYLNDYDFFVGIGDNQIRKTITKRLNELNIELPVLIHPSAIIDETVSIQPGTVVMANVVINADSKIGIGCIINTSSSVDHDCLINDYAHISPGVHIAGNVHIGEDVWIGTGAAIINNTNIYKDCIIGAGGVVIYDIKEKGIFVGCPIRRIR